jgi:hypothetical protein
VTLVLPAERWQRVGPASKPGYKYADKRRESGPITAIMVKNDNLTVKGKGAPLFPLVGAPQAIVTVRLQLGSGVAFCAAAPAKEPATSNDSTARFVGVRRSPAPADCSPVPDL